ncbi:MAG: TldD/PmbA family protein, partial [Dehalococcoidia bacterium]|nr:TldD/PmbA family protein [Dehalococcoidia bacterium]
MEHILSLANKVSDEAEVFRVFVEQTPVVFETNRLKQMQSQQSMVTTLRVVCKGRVGLATAAGPFSDEKLVERAVELAELGVSSHLEMPTREKYTNVRIK